MSRPAQFGLVAALLAAVAVAVIAEDYRSEFHRREDEWMAAEVCLGAEKPAAPHATADRWDPCGNGPVNEGRPA